MKTYSSHQVVNVYMRAYSKQIIDFEGAYCGVTHDLSINTVGAIGLRLSIDDDCIFNHVRVLHQDMGEIPPGIEVVRELINAVCERLEEECEQYDKRRNMLRKDTATRIEEGARRLLAELKGETLEEA